MIKWILFFSVLLLSAWSVQALYKARDFSTLRASYLTSLEARSEAQKNNISLAASKLNGQVTYPGLIFSFNQQLGPFDENQGYTKERSLEQGITTLTEGGGVCQLSSTVYNAAKKAGLIIEERNLHSAAVHSVPWGQDAAVAYGISDLKIKNNFSYPLRWVSKIENNSLKVEIWGK